MTKQKCTQGVQGVAGFRALVFLEFIDFSSTQPMTLL
jgi:hypothetical protein